MLVFYRDYLERLRELHSDIRNAIRDLPNQALDWSPDEDIPTFTVLVVHVCGAERYWIGDVADQDPSDRDRASEFRAKRSTVEELMSRLQAADDYAQIVLDKYTLGDLEKNRISGRDGKTFSLGWALLHALEHTAIHVGHLQLLRQLWDQKQAVANV